MTSSSVLSGKTSRPAESRFWTPGITSKQAKFDQLVGALSKESIGRVLDLIEVPPLFTPYTQLKARLLEAHQLTDYQKVDQLLKMESLGARHPSELLTTMLETCPRGQETNIFFTHLFLCRLPAELRIMLGEDNHQDVRNLVSNADKLWALHGQKNSLVASVDQPEEDSAVIAAVGATRGCVGRGNCGNRGNRSNRGSAVFQRPPASAWQPVVLPAASTTSASHWRRFGGNCLEPLRPGKDGEQPLFLPLVLG